MNFFDLGFSDLPDMKSVVLNPKEDVDEWCDPENPRKIKFDDVLVAAELINDQIRHPPCMASHLPKKFTMTLHYKLESLQKSGCFKLRGALCALLRMPVDKRKIGIVIASIGNEAIAMCYCAMMLTVPVISVFPSYVPISLLQRCHNMGSKIIVQGNTITEAMKYARSIAREKGLSYINARDHPDILAGYGTIGLEILHEIPDVDAIIVPVGTGGLIAAIGRVVKHHKPECQIYAAVPEMAPCFFKHLYSESPITGPVIPSGNSLADYIAVQYVSVNGYMNAKEVVDRAVLVSEDCIARAVTHMMEVQQLVVGAPAACPLAAIMSGQLPELRKKTVVCVVTGANLDNHIYMRALRRGLSAEVRVIKFNVVVPYTNTEVAKLYEMIASAGISILGHEESHKYLDDVFQTKINFTCQTYGMDHALALKRLIENEYTQVDFETEPFNDKRACPCFVYKHMPCGRY